MEHYWTVINIFQGQRSRRSGWLPNGEPPLSQTIVVGDADNDIAAMKKAGLAVAMKNANEHVKTLADVIVSDNDHDGCREVLQNYGFIR